MKNFVVLIQGQSNCVAQQKDAWKGFDVIFSTWVGEENKYTENDIVLYNTPPSTSGPANFNYQIVSTINGLVKAKELGYKNVLKIRSDLIPTNASKFFNVLDETKLNFLCWHAHEVYPGCSGYLVDYLISGPIDDMIKLWDISNIFCVVPEVMLTWQYINECKEMDVNYFMNELNNENDLWWIKNNIYLSSYKMSVHNPFNRTTYNIDKTHLTNSYLNFLN